MSRYPQHIYPSLNLNAMLFAKSVFIRFVEWDNKVLLAMVNQHPHWNLHFLNEAS
jgi:hypothetical protein